MGAAVVSSRTGREKEDAGSPVRTAMACSYWARAIRRLMYARLGGLQTEIRLRHRLRAVDPVACKLLRECKRLGVGFYRSLI